MTFLEQAAKLMWARIQASEKFHWQAGPDEFSIVKIDANSPMIGKPLMNSDRLIQTGDVIDYDWNNTGDSMLIESEADLLKTISDFDGQALARLGTVEDFVDGA